MTQGIIDAMRLGGGGGVVGGQLRPQSSDVLLHPHLYKIRTSINGLRGLSVMGSGPGRLL